jgi:uncharacterized membrane protein YozB (DUF420 family)
MPSPGILPTINAVLNFSSAILLAAGFYFIKRRNIAAHKASMIAALAVSALFLVCYVVYHASVGSVPFTGQGWMRPVYFGILVSHILLAVAILPMALRTAFLGLNKRYPEHVRIARWTFPMWMYVSVTGVVVYWMLYRM